VVPIPESNATKQIPKMAMPIMLSIKEKPRSTFKRAASDGLSHLIVMIARESATIVPEVIFLGNSKPQ
jgi:hypothetical protein